MPANETAAYRDTSLTIEERLEDLLPRMSPAEKVAQLMMLDAMRCNVAKTVVETQPAAFLHLLGDALDEAVELAATTPLGIPLLVAEDCIHGHSFWPGATIFPTQLALACSWNPGLVREVARVTAREARATGVHWTFSPVLCLTRDLRWGRVGETFGEDPFLIGELGAAMIHGYQGEGLNDHEGLLATAKHYAGYSETQGGRDSSEADISRRKLASFFLPPFRRAVEAGCMTFMTGYQSMDGIPSTANKWLLNDVLKQEWGFRGIVVTDYDNVGRLVHEQKTCATHAQAAAVAVQSGNDLMMQTPEFLQGALSALQEGLLHQDDIDAACRRVLALKFRMGLFENPRRALPGQITLHVASEEHRGINLQASRESVVLLRNEGVLPLDARRIRRIAVIGPNADNDLNQLGDWSLGSSQYPRERGRQPRTCTTTLLDGLRELARPGCEILAHHTCGSASERTAAARLAASADLVIMAVGDSLDYIGEMRSTATLELQDGQAELAEAVAATGRPMVVVVISSKPLVLPRFLSQAPALVQAFNPGMQGGRALAEILFGLVNPSGRLPVSIPRHVGQQPVCYSQVRGQHGDRYADLTQEPLFCFGDGLSYTTFALGRLRVEPGEIARGSGCRVEVEVTNTGSREGSETVQVYVEDCVTSATWVNRELKGFARVRLEAGQTDRVRIDLAPDAFSMVNAEGRRVIEPGDFTIFVGNSSRNSRLTAARVLVH